MMMESGEAPAELRRRVTSPNGTTQAALDSLAGDDLRAVMARALDPARRRGVELASAHDAAWCPPWHPHRTTRQFPPTAGPPSMPYFANALQLLIKVAFDAVLVLFLLRLFAEYWRADFHNPVSQFIYRYSNPVLVPVRRVIPNWRRLNLAALAIAWVA